VVPLLQGAHCSSLARPAHCGPFFACGPLPPLIDHQLKLRVLILFCRCAVILRQLGLSACPPLLLAAIPYAAHCSTIFDAMLRLCPVHQSQPVAAR
jgi:hypothetical protein